MYDGALIKNKYNKAIKIIPIPMNKYGFLNTVICGSSKTCRNLKFWQNFVKKSNIEPFSKKELKKAIFQGIPLSMKHKIWLFLMNRSIKYYEETICSCKSEKHILVNDNKFLKDSISHYKSKNTDSIQSVSSGNLGFKDSQPRQQDFYRNKISGLLSKEISVITNSRLSLSQNKIDYSKYVQNEQCYSSVTPKDTVEFTRFIQNRQECDTIPPKNTTDCSGIIRNYLEVKAILENHSNEKSENRIILRIGESPISASKDFFDSLYRQEFPLMTIILQPTSNDTDISSMKSNSNKFSGNQNHQMNLQSYIIQIIQEKNQYDDEISRYQDISTAHHFAAYKLSILEKNQKCQGYPISDLDDLHQSTFMRSNIDSTSSMSENISIKVYGHFLNNTKKILADKSKDAYTRSRIPIIEESPGSPENISTNKSSVSYSDFDSQNYQEIAGNLGNICTDGLEINGSESLINILNKIPQIFLIARIISTETKSNNKNIRETVGDRFENVPNCTKKGSNSCQIHYENIDHKHLNAVYQENTDQSIRYIFAFENKTKNKDSKSPLDFQNSDAENDSQSPMKSTVYAQQKNTSQKFNSYSDEFNINKDNILKRQQIDLLASLQQQICENIDIIDKYLSEKNLEKLQITIYYSQEACEKIRNTHTEGDKVLSPRTSEGSSDMLIEQIIVPSLLILFKRRLINFIDSKKDTKNTNSLPKDFWNPLKLVYLELRPFKPLDKSQIDTDSKDIIGPGYKGTHFVYFYISPKKNAQTGDIPSHNIHSEFPLTESTIVNQKVINLEGKTKKSTCISEIPSNRLKLQSDNSNSESFENEMVDRTIITIDSDLSQGQKVYNSCPVHDRNSNLEKILFSKERGEYDSTYKSLLSTLCFYEHQIHVDIQRTFKKHVLFYQEYGAGQSRLFNNLCAFASLFPKIGYCQGMSNFSAVILMYLPEKDAFKLLIHIFYQNNLYSIFDKSLSGVYSIVHYQGRVIEILLPKIYKHFTKNNIEVQIFVLGWYLTLFSRFDISLVLRIWDCLVAYDFTVLFIIGCGILKDVQRDILSRSGEDLLRYVSNIENLALDVDKILQFAYDHFGKIDLREYREKLGIKIMI